MISAAAWARDANISSNSVIGAMSIIFRIEQHAPDLPPMTLPPGS